MKYVLIVMAFTLTWLYLYMLEGRQNLLRQWVEDLLRERDERESASGRPST
jgi:hypothetical protein